MRRLCAVLAMVLSTPAPPAIAEQPDRAALLGDLCATPGDWAPPFTHVYSLRNGGTVVFVAVQHVSDLSSSTIAQLRAAFDRYRPGVVLVEGASAERSASDAYLHYLADTAEQHYAAGALQENLYAVKLAADARVQYLGWDMSPHDDYVADIANGFRIPDAIGAHLLRAHLDPFASPSPAAIESELHSVPHVRQPDSFDFAGWYRTTYGERYDPANGTPCGKGIASQIVRFESIRRTTNIIGLLDRYATPGSVVMVEAGANHWLALRDYLTSISKRVR